MERRRASCSPDTAHPKRPRPGDVEAVHSGQFMRSKVEDGPDGDEDSEEPFDAENSRGESRPRPSFDVLEADGLDALVKRISTTYCDRFSSPRWIDFKGVSLRGRDKVRMNNLLWREWHVQITAKQISSFCHFTCPLDDAIHRKPLAVVLEGKYWKKRLDAVVGEYKRWRVYWRARQRWKRRRSDGSQMDSLDGKVKAVVAERGVHVTVLTVCLQMSDKSSLVSQLSSVSSTVDSQGCETWNSDDPPGCSTSDNAFFASFMQSSWLLSQRREPDKQHDRVCLGPASEQDMFALTLIEDFLRNGEMEWQSDHAPDDPSMSLQDAIDILAAAAFPTPEPTEPSVSARCFETATRPAQSQVRRSAGPSDGCRTAKDHANTVAAVSQDKSFSEPASMSTKPQLDAKLATSLNLTQAPLERPVVTSGCDLDVLRQIVPSLRRSYPRKLTKTTMLEGTAEYCKELREDNRQLDDQIAMLKLQIELLKRETGVGVQNPIPSKETLHENLRRERFDAWVRARSSHNCKFPVFALLLAPFYTSFMSAVASSSEGQLDCTVFDWLNRHCSLAAFRQSVLAAITVLSRSTAMMANPEKLPQELLSRTISSWLVDARNPSHS